MEPTPQVSYLTQDHLGSPRVITNENGVVTSRKDFMAYGEEAASANRVSGSGGNGYDPAGTRKDYTGYEKDSETGLEYAQARYYNPTHGRYTSIDPMTASATIKNPQSFNRYSYVLNSPYKFVDPLGLISSQVGSASYGYCGASYDHCEGDYQGGNVGGGGGPASPNSTQTDDGVARHPNATNPNSQSQEPQEGNEHGDAGPESPDERQSSHNADIRQVADLNRRAIDAELTLIFTSGTGFVGAASSARTIGNGDNHFNLADGLLHTIHVYANFNGTEGGEVYVPARFSKWRYAGGVANSVIATDPISGEVLRVSHVAIYSQKMLDKNSSTRKLNSRGSIFIGMIGPQGGDPPWVHAHITYFANFKAMKDALDKKYSPNGLGDYTSNERKYLRDFRSFLKQR